MSAEQSPLAKVRAQVRALRAAEYKRDRAIRTAFEPERRRKHGYTVDDIAAAAGLSRPRIYQIVKESDRD